jgi:hypothetical protein
LDGPRNSPPHHPPQRPHSHFCPRRLCSRGLFRPGTRLRPRWHLRPQPSACCHHSRSLSLLRPTCLRSRRCRTEVSAQSCRHVLRYPRHITSHPIHFSADRDSGKQGGGGGSSRGLASFHRTLSSRRVQLHNPSSNQGSLSDVNSRTAQTHVWQGALSRACCRLQPRTRRVWLTRVGPAAPHSSCSRLQHRRSSWAEAVWKPPFVLRRHGRSPA